MILIIVIQQLKAPGKTADNNQYQGSSPELRGQVPPSNKLPCGKLGRLPFSGEGARKGKAS